MIFADSMRQTASMVLWTSRADTPGLSPIYACSATAFRLARPFSKSLPTMLSMFMNRHITFIMNACGPVIDQTDGLQTVEDLSGDVLGEAPLRHRPLEFGAGACARVELALVVGDLRDVHDLLLEGLHRRTEPLRADQPGVHLLGDLSEGRHLTDVVQLLGHAGVLSPTVLLIPGVTESRRGRSAIWTT